MTARQTVNIQPSQIFNFLFGFIRFCLGSKALLVHQVCCGGFYVTAINFNTEKQGIEYDKELKKVKRAYSPKDDIVCFKQIFSSDFLRNANEYLQSCIDHKRIFFASRTAASGSFFSKVSSAKVPLKMTHFNDIGEMIETQDTLIYQTKKQCALVEVKSTAKGTQTFDLPQHLRRSTSANRARKDNYTTLMLGNWAVKAYNDMKNIKVEEVNATFVPRMID